MKYKVIDKTSCLFGYSGVVEKENGEYVWLRFQGMFMLSGSHRNQLELTSEEL